MRNHVMLRDAARKLRNFAQFSIIKASRAMGW